MKLTEQWQIIYNYLCSQLQRQNSKGKWNYFYVFSFEKNKIKV